MTLHTPQIIYLIVLGLGTLKTLAHYGERKPLDHYDIVDLLVGPALGFGLLWWGGFFGGNCP